MTDNQFPPNPTDRMIVEVELGIFYQYDKSINSWVRLRGFNQFIDVASSDKDGLMTKDDFIKIYGLLVPPPSTTLIKDDCELDSGLIGLKSSNDDLFISGQLDLYSNQADGDKTLVKTTPFKIHDNTYGIDFRVNMNKLVQELKDRGQLTYCNWKGPQGKQGPRGDKGRDRLDTGPVGDRGVSGKNAPWPFKLTEDTNAQLNTPGRGIVDIATKQVSPTENYLVVTRANVGSFQSCPDKVKPNKSMSPWVLVIDDRPASIKQYKECSTSVTEKCCTESCGTVLYCSSNLYYIDITTIQEQCKERFETLLKEMKMAKEKLVSSWVDTMMSVFYESKKSICCALQNVTSRQANRDERHRLEEMRIQAAQADLQLKVDWAKNGSFVTNLDGSTGPQYRNVDNKVKSLDECADVAEFTLSGEDNISISSGITQSVPAGDYYIFINQCCAFNKQTGKYNMPVAMTYQLGENRIKLEIPDYGSYDTIIESANVYTGLNTRIRHDGGAVTMFFNTNTCTGEVTLTLKSAQCVDQAMACPASTPIQPSQSDLVCSVDANTVQFYESGWKTGACCGAYLELNNQKWIIVKRSIGVDTTCGGGAHENEPCIVAGLDQIQAHPAYAFPTVDGETWIGKPTSTQQMYRDISLETQVMAKICDGQVYKIKGDPKNNFEAILFPLNV